MLGINFCTNFDRTQEINYENVLCSVEKFFKEYRKFNLTLPGKVTVINILGIPKFVHTMSVLPSTKRFYLDNFLKLCNIFLWNGKKSKVCKQQLMQRVERGFKLFLQDLKVRWVKRLYKNEGAWQSICAEIFEVKKLVRYLS